MTRPAEKHRESKVWVQIMGSVMEDWREQQGAALSCNVSSQKHVFPNQTSSFFLPGMHQYQQAAPTTPMLLRWPCCTPDRIPPATASCLWARGRSPRGGTVASWTTGSPSRSCSLTARTHPTARRCTTLCCPSPRCDGALTGSRRCNDRTNDFRLEAWWKSKEKCVKN